MAEKILRYYESSAESVVMASYERSGLSFEEYSRKAIDFAKSDEEVKRRAKTDKRMQILRDDWRTLLQSALNSWLQPEIFKLVGADLLDNLDLSNNPAKHIWQDLSVLYKLPPKRYTPENSEDVDKYNDLLAGTDFDLFWQMAELMLNACREIVIWPHITKDLDGNQTINHRVECGNTMSVITYPEDKTKIECYIHLYETRDIDGKKITQYRIWTDKWYGVFVEDEGDEVHGLSRVDFVDPDLTKESDIVSMNPYGVLPHTMIRLIDWQDKIWDTESGRDVVDLTIKGGRERAFYRYLQKVSGFKQGVVYGGGVDKFEQKIMDPAYLVKIPGHDTSFTVVDWSVNLGERQSCMMNDELSVAAAHGINPQRYKSGGDYQTSFAAKSAERGLQEYRERIKPIFKSAESAYREKLLIVAAAHGLGKLPNSKIEMDIIHAPMQYPENPIIQAELDIKKIQMGTSSQLDVIKREHPQFTDKQAKDELERIMEDIAYVNDMKSKHNIADDPTVQSQDAQENGKLGPMEKEKKKVEQENK